MTDVNDGNGQAGPGSPGATAPGADASGPDGADSGKRLERKLTGRWLAGVCAGVGDYLGVDPTVIRVIFAVLTLFGGFGALAYVLAWALIPEQGETKSIAENMINKTGA